MIPRTTQLTAILTRCEACESHGIAAWEPTPGFSIDQALVGLRSHCPDCGADGRSATPLVDGPDEAEHPDLAAMWREMQELHSASASTMRPGRNEPCPCGSGEKYKRCCGS